LDDVDYLLGHHLFSGWPTGQITGGLGGFLATAKFDAVISGTGAHAAASPQTGKNALLAAATAVLNLHAIPRHRGGTTRINVGRLEAGTARNVIPPQAHLLIETRGETTELNAYMYDYALRILKSAAAMHGCAVQIKAMGGAESADSDPTLAERVEQLALELGDFTLRLPEKGGGSEDFTYMMKKVQNYDGLAASIGIGANLGGWGHHTADFDIDETALALAVRLLAAVTLDIMNEQIPDMSN
jgi:aminobenzoyl-glutamate utilization protein A